MLEKLILNVKNYNPDVIEVVDIKVDEGLVFVLTEKELGEKATIIAYHVENQNVQEVTKVTAYWKNDHATLDITENGVSRTVQTDFTKNQSNVTERASACETAVNILCSVGGITACNAACRAIPIIGLLLGFTVCRTLCGSIVGDGCDAAKKKFC